MPVKTIITKSNLADREITINLPKVLDCNSIADLTALQGEELTLMQAKAQLTVSFRAMIRTKLEATDDNEDVKYTDEILLKEDFSDWKPSIRSRKSEREKAVEALGAVDLNDLDDIIKQAKALQAVNVANAAKEVKDKK